MTGKYGGAAFILIYLGFLVLLGLPILVSEFAVGRSSRLSTARAFHKLEPEGSNFHKYSYMGMIGNYMLMMFYTMVAGLHWKQSDVSRNARVMLHLPCFLVVLSQRQPVFMVL